MTASENTIVSLRDIGKQMGQELPWYWEFAEAAGEIRMYPSTNKDYIDIDLRQLEIMVYRLRKRMTNG